MRPFKQKIAIVEASGNNLDLEGTTKFYIKAAQVLGAETFYPMEAAVLNGNSTDNELLICLDTSIAWNLVPSNFPNVTLEQHFKEKLEPTDRIRAPRVRIKIDPTKLKNT